MDIKLHVSGTNPDLFAVVLAGHPKLKNLLRHPAMEEIGARATVLTLEGIQGQQQEYLTWLLDACAEPGREAVLTPAAFARLAEALATPLQVEQYLPLALEEAYRAGQRPVTPDLIDSVLATGLNDVEPTLARYGYTAREVAELLHVRPMEVRAFLRGRLPAGRAQELQHELRAVGIPLESRHRDSIWARTDVDKRWAPNVTPFIEHVSRRWALMARRPADVCEPQRPEGALAKCGVTA